MSLEIFLNILVISFLSIGIVYAIILEHRFLGIKENYRQLSLLITQFYQASEKIQKEIISLTEKERKEHQNLKNDLHHAICVRDEIKALLEKTKSVIASYPHSGVFLTDASSMENQDMVSKNIQKDSLE